MQSEHTHAVAHHIDDIGHKGDIHGHIGLTNAAAEGGTSIINRQGWKRQCGDKQIGFASRHDIRLDLPEQKPQERLAETQDEYGQGR